MPTQELVTNLISALPALSQQELRLVRAAADRLLGQQSYAASPLYAALAAAAGSRLPFARFQKTAAFKVWVKNEPEAMAFIAETWPGLNKVQLYTMMIYLAEMLRDYLRDRKVPVTVGTLAVNLGSLPQAFDENFPGYRTAGLAHLVVRRAFK